jgi:hypothetical protein
MPDTTPERDEAAAWQQRYSAAAKRLQADTDLTPEARDRRLAQEWKTTRGALDRLQAKETARLTSRVRDLEVRLFGPTHSEVTDAISMRDAQDRASQLLTPAEAAELLSRAEQNGDQVLARAVAQRVAAQSRQALGARAGEWDDVLGTFVDARPAVMPLVEELAQIERLTTRTVLGPFSLSAPHGIPQQLLNEAVADAHATSPSLQYAS